MAQLFGYATWIPIDTKDSFRIGAATYAAKQGVPDDKITHWGRWKSDAFKKYIRITSLESISYWNVSEVVMLLVAGVAQLWNLGFRE